MLYTRLDSNQQGKSAGQEPNWLAASPCSHAASKPVQFYKLTSQHVLAKDKVSHLQSESPPSAASPDCWTIGTHTSTFAGGHEVLSQVTEYKMANQA